MYIGQTINFKRRKDRHFSDLRRQDHHNKHLQNAFNKYGEEHFQCYILETLDVSKNEISQIEKDFILQYNSFNNGYNCNEGGYDNNGFTSKFNKKDVFDILSCIEFYSRPGQVLADIFETSRTSISRIKRGAIHFEWKHEYTSLDINKRKQIFENFCHETDFISRKNKSTIIKSKRKLSKEQVFLLLAVNEFMSRDYFPKLKKLFNIQSMNTFITIVNNNSYKDYSEEYINLSLSDRKAILRHHIEIYDSKVF